MALAERRSIHAFKNDKLQGYIDQINAVVGGEMSIEIIWDQMNVDGSANYLQDTLISNYFDPLIYAFKEICVDDFGKQAILEQIKKIVLQNTASNSPNISGLSYADSILTIDVSPYYQPSLASDWNKAVLKYVESNLR